MPTRGQSGKHSTRQSKDTSSVARAPTYAPTHAAATGLHTREGIRAVALFEAAKGALVLLAGIGIFLLIHQDLHALASGLVLHTHLNPASHRATVFMDLADRMSESNLWLLALGALAYSTVRFVEAYGLWFRQKWAEWFAVASGAIYIPFEVLELFRRPGWLTALLLLLNAAIVTFLLYALRQQRPALAARRALPATRR